MLLFFLLVLIQLAFSFFGICSISVGGLSLEHGSDTEDQALGMYRMLSEVDPELLTLNHTPKTQTSNPQLGSGDVPHAVRS